MNKVQKVFWSTSVSCNATRDTSALEFMKVWRQKQIQSPIHHNSRKSGDEKKMGGGGEKNRHSLEACVLLEFILTNNFNTIKQFMSMLHVLMPVPRLLLVLLLLHCCQQFVLITRKTWYWKYVKRKCWASK